MPIDRNAPNNSRPLKPTLASNRTAAKTPVTPRLALAPSSPASSTSQTSRTVRSANGITPRLAAPIKEDTTPAKSFLSSNITPRTSSRKSRVGVSSNSSTPNVSPATTPISSRPSSTVDFAHREHGSAQSGPAINTNHSAPAGHRPRSIVGGNNHNLTPTPRLPLSSIYNHGPSETGQTKDVSPMFFHANSVKSPKEQMPPQKKPAVFFHANGDQVSGPRRPIIPSPPSSAVSRPSSVVGKALSNVGKASSTVGKAQSRRFNSRSAIAAYIESFGCCICTRLAAECSCCTGTHGSSSLANQGLGSSFLSQGCLTNYAAKPAHSQFGSISPLWYQCNRGV